MSVTRQLLLLLLVGGLAAGGYLYVWPMLGAGEAKESDADKRGGGGKPVAVVLAEVGRAVERIRVEAVGTARAERSARLHAAAAGEVVAINFTADQAVRGGSVLLELDREAEELAVDLARVRLADAQRVFDRFSRLMSTGAAAQASLDDARTNLEAARIELKRAEVSLSDRFVVAPFGGRIGLTETDIGDRVDSDTEIATLDDRGSLLVRFDVPEVLLGRVSGGDAVVVEPWTSTGEATVGQVVDVGSRVDEQTRTFVVRARIPNTDDTLRPGMSFRVTLDVEGRAYPKVPEIAIQWGGEGSFLWAVTDGTARRVPISIVQRQEAEVLVDGSVGPDDRVVVEGLHRMRPGTKIEVHAPTAKRPPIPAAVKGHQS